MSRTLQWGALGLTLVLIFGVWLVTKNASTLQQDVYAKLENHFGFSSSIISIEHEGERKELLKIKPVENGLLFEAGFRSGDVIVSHRKPAFYALLYQKKGKTEEIDVVRGNVDFSLNKNNITKIKFRIPG